MESLIGWVGGKKRLREKIIAQFPAEYNMYVEVFGGAGWVLFARDKHAKNEVYNDINSNLVNLFRCVKYHKDEFVKELAYCISAREIFNGYKKSLNNVELTDIQRAARFFYLVKYSFGCKYQSYATRGKSMDSALNRVDMLAERLNKVVIENKAYMDLIKIYDKPNTLFYLDPPYHNTEKYYQTPCIFDEKDHLRLAQTLSEIEGKFILSYNDDAYIRDLYSKFNIYEICRRENLSAKNGSNPFKELIITNFKK